MLTQPTRHRKRRSKESYRAWGLRWADCSPKGSGRNGQGKPVEKLQRSLAIFSQAMAGLLVAAWIAACGIMPCVLGQSTPPKPPPHETRPITASEAERFGPMQRTCYAAALRGSEWLARQQRADGTFPSGLEPALGCPAEEDHYLRQIQATLALAQAARLTGEERWAARARQAVLVLLAATTTDPHNGQCRYPRPPLVSTGRLSAAGLLLATIHQLPQPGEDLLEPAEQLARWIARQQQADGTLQLSDVGPAVPVQLAIAEERDPLLFGPGQALWGVMRSCSTRPQAWKLDLLRRARQPYFRLCQQHCTRLGLPATNTPDRSPTATEACPGSPILAVWHIAAWCEAFRYTQERAFAEFAFELTDALLQLQYTEASRPMFLGGFAESLASRLREQPPDWRTGWYAWALVHAASTARLAGDQARYQRYTLAAESALQFLTTLQYTSLNTAHFSPEYQPQVLGGFRRGVRDGVITLDAQHAAVCAFWSYFELIVRP